MPSVVAVIQARMGSKRFPGKSMEKIGGKPLLWHVIRRVKLARLVDKVILAIPDTPENRVLERLGKRCGVQVYKQEAIFENDLLHRFRQATLQVPADYIVRITGDCPCIDPQVIDATIHFCCAGHYDYVKANTLLNLPDGYDVEVFTPELLEEACKKASAAEAEHVGPWMEAHAHRKANLPRTTRVKLSVDAPVDLALVRELYEQLGQDFNVQEAVNYIETREEEHGVPQGNQEFY